MGLLDGVAGMLGGSDGSNNAVAAIVQMLQQHPCGLGGLVGQLQQGGMGDLVNSWLSSGQNLPVSGGQLSDIFSHGQLSDLANQLGTDHAGALSQLSQLLPGIIDQLSPQGSLPPEHSWMSAAAGILGGLMNR